MVVLILFSTEVNKYTFACVCDAFGVRQNVVVVVKKSFSTSSKHTARQQKILMLILTKSSFDLF